MRATNADFRVTEVLSFEPSGDGEHEYLEIEKSGITTLEAAERLARAASVHPKTIGFSGLKDRHAVTSQWFSVQARSPVDWEQFDASAMRILRRARHRRKLKRGAHRANRFQLVLRSLRNVGDLERRLEWLRQNGMPNYFAEQRFGRGVRNVELARALFSGKRLRRPQRSMAISAARSLIFNRVLSERVGAGTWNRLLPGDVAGLDGSGSVFPVAAVDESLEKRIGEFDIHPTGPLWGAGEPMTAGQVAALESRCADEYPELGAGLVALGTMARRALRAQIRELEWTVGDETLQLSFTLARGQYATALIRELVHASEPNAR